MQRPTNDPAERADPLAESNWALLLEVIGDRNTLLISADSTANRDTVSSDSTANRDTVSVVLIADGKRRSATAATLEHCLLDLAGRQRTKTCATCHVAQSLFAFSLLKESSDGRNRRCRVCERQRVSAAQRRATAQRRAG